MNVYGAEITRNAMKIIESIKVKRLFGYINFEIKEKNLFDDKFMYVFAENGMGKTTLLNILFSLLSTTNGQGLKGALTRVPFLSISVNLTNGAVIEARRKKADGRKYTLAISHKKMKFKNQ